MAIFFGAGMCLAGMAGGLVILVLELLGYQPDLSGDWVWWVCGIGGLLAQGSVFMGRWRPGQ